MPIPDYQSLTLPVLETSADGEARIGAVVDMLADRLGLTLEERSALLSSGKQTIFSNRVHWAKSYLSKAHLVEITRRGYFRITSRGEAGTSTIEDQKQTPDEIMRAAYRQIETTLAQDMLERIRKAPPEFFERLMVNLLLSMGYGGSAEEAGRTLGRSGDDGVDGVVDQAPLGLDRVYIQAKRYAAGNNVGAGAIRDFFGSLDST